MVVLAVPPVAALMAVAIPEAAVLTVVIREATAAGRARTVRVRTVPVQAVERIPAVRRPVGTRDARSTNPVSAVSG